MKLWDYTLYQTDIMLVNHPKFVSLCPINPILVISSNGTYWDGFGTL